MEKRGQEMATLLLLGPADHGQALTRQEFENAQYTDGGRYELIEGKLYVSPVPNLLHDLMVTWLQDKFSAYAKSHRVVINYVSGHSRVFIPGEEEETSPEPDLAAYHDFPFHIPKRQLSWRRVHPILVVEVLSEDDRQKDLVRNVALYRRVPSIREYWILDPRADADFPNLRVYRRRGQHWQPVKRVPGGGTYATRLLPGFSLVLDTSTE